MNVNLKDVNVTKLRTARNPEYGRSTLKYTDLNICSISCKILNNDYSNLRLLS